MGMNLRKWFRVPVDPVPEGEDHYSRMVREVRNHWPSTDNFRPVRDADILGNPIIGWTFSFPKKIFPRHGWVTTGGIVSTEYYSSVYIAEEAMKNAIRFDEQIRNSENERQ